MPKSTNWYSIAAESDELRLLHRENKLGSPVLAPCDEKMVYFEEKLLPRLREWSTYIADHELDHLIAVVAEAQNISGEISESGGPEDETAQKKWQTLAEEGARLISPIIKHLERIRGEAQSDLGLINQGRRGLRGYRQNPGRNRNFFDSTA